MEIGKSQKSPRLNPLRGAPVGALGLNSPSGFNGVKIQPQYHLPELRGRHRLTPVRFSEPTGHRHLSERPQLNSPPEFHWASMLRQKMSSLREKTEVGCHPSSPSATPWQGGRMSEVSRLRKATSCQEGRRSGKDRCQMSEVRKRQRTYRLFFLFIPGQPRC